MSANQYFNPVPKVTLGSEVLEQINGALGLSFESLSRSAFMDHVVGSKGLTDNILGLNDLTPKFAQNAIGSIDWGNAQNIKGILGSVPSSWNETERAITLAASQYSPTQIDSLMSKIRGWGITESDPDFVSESMRKLTNGWSQLDVNKNLIRNHLSLIGSPASAALAEMNAFDLAWKSPELSDTLTDLLSVNTNDAIKKAMMPLFDAIPKWHLYLPPNLRNLDKRFTPRDIQVFIEKDSIPIAYIPRAEVVAELLEAESAEDRRYTLNRFKSQIIEDCEAAVADLDEAKFTDVVAQLSEGIDALKAGLFRPAQAAFTPAIDWMVFAAKKILPLENITNTGMKNGSPNANNKQGQEELDQMHIGDALVWAPIRSAHYTFDRNSREITRSEYGRHVTTHSISGSQYTEVNAIHSMMLAVSFSIHYVKLVEEVEQESRAVA
ncbi:hypothetical protein [Corynebacterium macclintockiae]|uniref:hypothetical protein n=1 Tax=Corynebacterium macclintockiae TaxID=2913501 RepID=UPI003EB9D299